MATRKAKAVGSKKRSKARKQAAQPSLSSELAECFALFADPKFTGNHQRAPVSRIIFSCQGEITSPPDFDCMGYGAGPSGEIFSACGTLDLTAFFATGINKKNFAVACQQVTPALQQLASSKAFAAIPKTGPIIFALAIEDQLQQVLGRIHPDGRFELPPPRP